MTALSASISVNDVTTTGTLQFMMFPLHYKGEQSVPLSA